MDVPDPPDPDAAPPEASLIERRPTVAADDDYDLVVIGGGIHGACLVLEAARRGLATLLLERDDFGGATSWNSLRILHGGLRYLQTLDLSRYHESVAERRWFMRHFPEQVERLSCLMPLHGDGLRRPSVFAAALVLDDLLSRHRNDGLGREAHLDAGRTLTPRETVELFPEADSARLLGAALWHDAFMPHAPRMLIEILRWAAAAGGRALNYVEATGLSIGGGRVAGVTAIDRESGRAHEFRTRRVVNCAGPWSREVSARLDREIPELCRPTLAFNLLLDRQPSTELAIAISPPTQDRSYFLVPWRGRLMAGTYHEACEMDRAEPTADDPAVRTFLRELGAAVPALELEHAEVLRVLWGRLPAHPDDPEAAAVRPVVHDHGRHGGPLGLVSVSGPKYTTARALAEATLRVLYAGEPPPPGTTPRPEPARWPTADEIDRAGAADAELAERLRQLARAESVVQPDDLLLRRTDLGLDPTALEGACRKVTQLLSVVPTEELSE